jgi:uncharacterized protein
MSTTIAIITFALLLIAFFTHILSFPANWLMILILAAWSWLSPDSSSILSTLLVFVGLAFLGECIEFVLQTVGARKYGSSPTGDWGAFLGAICGAIIGAPFFLGLGALAGAVGGAYLGCLGGELIKRRSLSEARMAAKGAMIGKILGMAVKIGIGFFFLVQSLELLF